MATAGRPGGIAPTRSTARRQRWARMGARGDPNRDPESGAVRLAAAMELVGRETELAASTSRAGGARGRAARARAARRGRDRQERAAGRARASARARRGLLVLEGRAAEHERDVPFGVVVDALDDHVATLHRRRVEALGPDLGAPCCRPPRAHATRAGDVGAAPRERFRYHRALRALLELLGPRAAGRAAARRPALGRRGVGRARAAPAAPPAARAAPARVRAAPGRSGAAAARRRAQRAGLGAAGARAARPRRGARAAGRRAPIRALRERLAREAAGNPLFLQRARARRRPAGRRAAADADRRRRARGRGAAAARRAR